ncbi:MAG: hypothetical protein HRU19_15250 [Pseudobacteriovorax sp.]|nr:hypothetical protein [Pseudobacteriovorax sp.]
MDMFATKRWMVTFLFVLTPSSALAELIILDADYQIRSLPDRDIKRDFKQEIESLQERLIEFSEDQGVIFSEKLSETIRGDGFAPLTLEVQSADNLFCQPHILFPDDSENIQQGSRVSFRPELISLSRQWTPQAFFRCELRNQRRGDVEPSRIIYRYNGNSSSQTILSFRESLIAEGLPRQWLEKAYLEAVIFGLENEIYQLTEDPSIALPSFVWEAYFRDKYDRFSEDSGRQFAVVVKDSVFPRDLAPVHDDLTGRAIAAFPFALGNGSSSLFVEFFFSRSQPISIPVDFSSFPAGRFSYAAYLSYLGDVLGAERLAALIDTTYNVYFGGGVENQNWRFWAEFFVSPGNISLISPQAWGEAIIFVD